MRAFLYRLSYKNRSRQQLAQDRRWGRIGRNSPAAFAIAAFVTPFARETLYLIGWIPEVDEPIEEVVDHEGLHLVLQRLGLRVASKGLDKMCDKHNSMAWPLDEARWLPCEGE
jgi:hypothetical protein